MTQKSWPHWETIDELAKGMGVTEVARIQWKQRGFVPHRFRLPMVEKAARLKIKLTSADFFDPSKIDERAA